MPDKVYWTTAEKRQACCAALDIQASRPDLAGLPLLRAAIKTLPKDRQRRLVSLSQTGWFEEGMAVEAKLRAANAQSVDPTLSALGHQQESTLKIEAHTHATAAQRVALEIHHRDWRTDQLTVLGHIDDIVADLDDENSAAHQEHLDRVAQLTAILTSTSQDSREIAEQLSDIAETAMAIHGDHMAICLLLKGILQEVTMLKHLVLGIPGYASELDHAREKKPSSGDIAAQEIMAKIHAYLNPNK